MEARAKPRRRTFEGLWRKPVLGRGGATPRPGSMTEYIRDTGLLAPTEVDRIVRDAPTALVDFQRTQALLPVDERETIGDWHADYHRGLNAWGGEAEWRSVAWGKVGASGKERGGGGA